MKGQRAVTVAGDLTLGAGFVAVSIVLVIELGNMWLPAGVVIALGIWAGLVALLALPAVALLCTSPPRLPLSQRNALFSSAVWFGRTVWAGAVFAFSIVLGSTTGIVASRISDTQHNLGTALGESFVAVSQIALWPVLLLVAMVGYIVMGVRWLRDVGHLVETGKAAEMGDTVETRWFAPRGQSPEHTRRRAMLMTVLASFVGRIGLFLTLVTVGLSVAFAIGTLSHR
jgi:hypothetical protein